MYLHSPLVVSHPQRRIGPEPCAAAISRRRDQQLTDNAPALSLRMKQRPYVLRRPDDEAGRPQTRFPETPEKQA